MARTVSYLWRVFATYFAFFVFNVGGLLAAATAIAICRLIPGSREKKEQRAQRVIQFMFASFINGLVCLGLLTHSKKDFARLRSSRASLVIANHPTLLDVVFLIASMPHVDCVVKEAVWNNIFMRATVRGAGYIPNRDGVQLIDACVERIARGHHVLAFPKARARPRERCVTSNAARRAWRCALAARSCRS